MNLDLALTLDVSGLTLLQFAGLMDRLQNALEIHDGKRRLVRMRLAKQ